MQNISAFLPKNPGPFSNRMCLSRISAMLLSVLGTTACDNKKEGAKIPPPPVEERAMISNFTLDAASEPVKLRFPRVPFRIEEMPGDTLDQKIKLFIAQVSEKGDPTMQVIKKALYGDDIEIKFMYPEDTNSLLSLLTSKPVGGLPGLTFDGYVTKIPGNERIDGGTKDVCIVTLARDGMGENFGLHMLAGLIANESFGLIFTLKNNSEPKNKQITFDGQNFQIPNWVYQVAGLYLFQEGISSLCDELVEQRYAENNPNIYMDAEQSWSDFCKNLKGGRFTNNSPQHYARVYFGQQLNSLFPGITNKSEFHSILEGLYQASVKSVTENPATKKLFFDITGYLKLTTKKE